MTEIFEIVGQANALAYRVVIEGCPFEAVTHPGMVRAASTTGSPVTAYNAARVEGLALRDVEFSIKADPVSCKLDVGGFELKLVDIGQAWSRVFDLEATANTWFVTPNVNTTDVNIGCLQCDNFGPTPGVGLAWIDGEAFYYGALEGNNFGECLRGVLSPDGTGTSAQYHYVTDGARTRSPEITNWPVLWEGRRIVVYRYDEGDSLTGDGHARYRGLITTSPRFDGTTWTIGVDHMSKLLDQKFGEDLSIELAPRGIHYTTSSPFILNWAQRTSLNFATQVQGSVVLVGFYETQETFCDALTSAIATSFTTYGGKGTMTAISEGASGWHLRYHTSTAGNLKECQVQIWATFAAPIDPPLGAMPNPTGLASPVPAGEWGFPQEVDGDPVGDIIGTSLTGDADYYFYRPRAPNSAGTASVPVPTIAGSVPRGSWFYADDSAGRTFYLDSSTPISSSITSVLVSGTDAASGADFEETYLVESVDATNRTVTITPLGFSQHWYLSDKPPKIRLGLALMDDATVPIGGSIADVLDFVAANSAQYQTLGILPGLRTQDYDSAAWHAIFDTLPPINNRRIFTTFVPVSLSDIITEELKAAGCFLAINNDGELIPARIRLAAQTEISATATIDAATRLLTDKARVSHDVTGLGQVNTVTYRTGYSASKDDFLGDTITVRDVAAFGRSPVASTQEIAQRSQYIGSDPITADDVLGLVAAPILGAFSGPYSIDTIDAAKSQQVQVGDPITFDNPYLVDSGGTSSTGFPLADLGVLGRVGIVLGKTWGAYSPRTRFTVLNTKQKIGGYAPAGFKSSYVDLGSNVFQITLASTYFPSSPSLVTTAADFFDVGDRVRIVEFNKASAAKVSGTVTVVASNVVTVAFDGAWTPGASTWYLAPASATDTASQTAQYKFCYVADATGRIDTGGPHDQSAKVFAP